jgi:hypothetical protein
MDSTNYSNNFSIFPEANRLSIHGGNVHSLNVLCYLEVAMLSSAYFTVLVIIG